MKAIYESGKRGDLQEAICERYGVDQGHVGRILRGEQWGSVTGGKSVSQSGRRALADRNGNGKLTLAEREEIVRTYGKGGVTQAELGQLYSVSQVTISRTLQAARSHK